MLTRSQEQELRAGAEVVRERVYFACLSSPITFPDSPPFGSNSYKLTFGNDASPTPVHIFSMEAELHYEPFFMDFGPLNIGHLYEFAQLLNAKLNDPALRSSRIICICSKRPEAKSNFAWLMGGYGVVYQGRTPDQAYAPLAKLGPYIPFRDASYAPTCTFKLTIKHCLQALYRAMEQKFFDFDNFDIDEYHYYESVENGDLNTIVPKKFVAFSSPRSGAFTEEDYPSLTPIQYLPVMKKFGVSAIVRLNQPFYDREHFIENGLRHYDMFFIDGTTPSEQLLNEFIKIAEETTDGSIAIHCKAGLGRTGTLIACYMIKHYQFNAEEAIAWTRICRPGCVIGPQQHFVKQQEARLLREGRWYYKAQAIRSNSTSSLSPLSSRAPQTARKSLATSPTSAGSPRRPGTSRRSSSGFPLSPSNASAMEVDTDLSEKKEFSSSATPPVIGAHRLRRHQSDSQVPIPDEAMQAEAKTDEDELPSPMEIDREDAMTSRTSVSTASRRSSSRLSMKSVPPKTPSSASQSRGMKASSSVTPKRGLEPNSPRKTSALPSSVSQSFSRGRASGSQTARNRAKSAAPARSRKNAALARAEKGPSEAPSVVDREGQSGLSQGDILMQIKRNKLKSKSQKSHTGVTTEQIGRSKAI